KPRAARLADRGLAEHIDRHRPGPGAAHGDRDRHLCAEHAPRVEDRVAGQYRAELCALRHGLGRGVSDPVARLLALDRVRGTGRGCGAGRRPRGAHGQPPVPATTCEQSISEVTSIGVGSAPPPLTWLANESAWVL